MLQALFQPLISVHAADVAELRTTCQEETLLMSTVGDFAEDTVVDSLP